jgi:multisubunit Na+/H+ antiporter MnhB subunit
MIIVRTITRLLLPLIIIFAIYVGTHGHLGPGGAFSAGAIIVSAILLFSITHLLGGGRLMGEHPSKKLDLIYLVDASGILLLLFLFLLTILVIQITPHILVRYPGTLFSSIPVFMMNIFGSLIVLIGLGTIIISFVRWAND